MRHYVDLKPHLNFRLAYPKETAFGKEFIESNTVCFLQEELGCGAIGNGEAEIRLERARNYDCVECDNQIVDILNVKCNGITVAGCCAWGIYREKFKAVFDDGTYSSFQVSFGDWAWDHKLWMRTAMEAEGADLAFNVLKEYTRRDGQAFIYYDKIKFPEPKKVKQIIFPDNICMYIFGITIYGEK